VIYLYLNSYTAQVLLNSLFSGAGAADIVRVGGNPLRKSCVSVWWDAKVSSWRSAEIPGTNGWWNANSICPVCGDRAGRTQECGDSEVRIFLWPVKPSAENVRVGRTNVWSNFWKPGIARSHDMMAERQKLRENCKFEIIFRTKWRSNGKTQKIRLGNFLPNNYFLISNLIKIFLR